MGSNERIFAILTLCGIIGVVFAIIFQLLYDQAIFIDEFITGSSITLRELQLVTIILWEVFGIVVAAIQQ